MIKIIKNLFKKKSNWGKSSLLLFTSFTAVALLTMTAAGLVIQQLNSTKSQIYEIVNTNNEKSRLYVEMQKAARERSLLLYKMVNQRDPFDRDETYIQLKRQAGIFLLARQNLLKIPLSDEEKKLFEEQTELTIYSVKIQNQVVLHLQNDEFKSAYDLLLEKSIPAQDTVINQLSNLIHFQHLNNEKIVSHFKQEFRKNTLLFIISVITILIFTFIIASYVIRRIVKTEKQLFFEKELAQITLNSIGDGVITVDKDYYIQSINPVAETLAGIKRKSVIGGNILTIYKQRSGNQKKNIDDLFISSEVKRSLFDFTLIQADGTHNEVEHTIAPIIDINNVVLGAVIILRDVTKIRSMEKRLSYQASHDALTGLINRREFEVRLKQSIRNAHTEHTTHSICFMDMDKFKIINDTSGHAAGDEFLKQVSKTIQSILRQTDVLARLGGDEFGIILESCSINQAEIICSQIIKTIKDTRFHWNKNSFEVSASIGIVPISQLTSSVSEVMGSVDAACYEAKDKGRNRIQVFEPDDAEYVKHKKETSWIQKIKTAIANDSFELYYQEIMPLNKYLPQAKTVELLLRLNIADKVISPDSFIPTAERYDMMPLIDAWVISHAFDFLNLYKQQKNTDIRIAINLSGQSLSEDSVLNLITRHIRKNKSLIKENICFEITETAAIANLSRAIEFITSVKHMGCKFSLDDFGSGLSSFSYLKNMPVDNLKIDGIFIRDINVDPINKAFVESIHNIGKMMGLNTTAEYVESEAILDTIKEIGIDYAQGYHIGKPAPLKLLLDTTEAKLVNK